MKIRLTEVLILALIGVLSILSPFAAAAGRPNTIPALREWTDGSGAYTFSSSSRIVYNGSGLAGDAATFANDLFKLTGFTITTVNGTNPNAGDIYMTLGASDPDIGNEGYLLTITDRVTISAKANAGAFYGTRSILQLLKQSLTIAAGTARDWPDYPQRGLMVDCGRKYFTAAWFKNHILDLAYIKNNYLHMHLSDNEGFRIECASHPEIVTAPYLTKAEMAEIIALATQYHIMVVPEIDTPSHTKAILDAHPELKLGSNADKMDISLPGAYTLVGDLLNEYLPLFPGPYWHAGADEYLGNGGYGNYPQFLTFVRSHYGPTAIHQDIFNYWNNWINGIVKAHGKNMRAWNEALTSIIPAASSLDTDIVLECWNSGPSAAFNHGNVVMNCHRSRTYYVLGAGSYKFSASDAYAWDPSIFMNNETIAPRDPRNLGAKAHIWCDNPGQKTEDEITAGIFKTMRSLAQVEWGSPKLVPTYASFDPIIVALGHAPGFGSAPPPPDTQAPTAPANLTAAAVSSSRIDLAWTASTDNVGVTGYQIFRGGVQVGTSVTTSYSDTSLSPNTTYSYYVKAYDAAGNISNQSNTASATTQSSGGDTQAPSVPANLAATAVSSSQINLVWTASTDNIGVTGYQVFRNGAQVGTSGTTSYADAGLSPNTTYSYYVKAYDAAGNVSAQSNTAQATTQSGGGGGNLALGRPVAASSEESAGRAAPYAVDGNTGTRWASASGSDPQWIQVDLGAVYAISRVVLNWEAAYAKSYQIQVSNDAVNWTTIYSTAIGNGGIDDLTVAGTGRYVRMYGTARYRKTWGYSLWEFEVYQ